MREIKLRVQVLRPLASVARGALPLVGGVCWGVTAGNESHNASNARGVAAGKMGRNSSNHTISPLRPLVFSLARCISTSACHAGDRVSIPGPGAWHY